MKICLCGSTRFMDQFHAANVELSLAGHVVYSVATSTKGDFKPTEDQKLALDAVHLMKIDESDAIMVVGRQEDGSLYIGDSTRRELMYAAQRGKEIYFWSPLSEGKEAEGPVMDFTNAIKAAATTQAERDKIKAEREAERREMMERFRGKGVGLVEIDGDGNVIGEPEASSQPN